MTEGSTPVYIYELRDPRDGRTYYVGKTSQPRRRLKQHLRDAEEHPSTAKGRWLLSLRVDSVMPRLVVVRRVSAREWQAVEAAAIQDHVKRGSPLTNIIIPRDRSGRRRRPVVDMRSQDYWDDLTPQFPELKRRVWIVRTPEGLLPYFLWNHLGQGWRLQQVAHHPSGSSLLGPLEPWGFGRRAEIVKHFDWWREAVLARLLAPDLYSESVPIEEALSPLELGEADGWKAKRQARVRLIG